MVRDYGKKFFVNPFKRRENKPKFNTKLYVNIILAVFAVYVVLYSDLFMIKQVDLTGLDLIDQNEFRGVVNHELNSFKWRILPRRNQLFFSKDKLIKAINNKYNLDELNVNESWHDLSIDLVEKPANVIIHDANKDLFYFANLDGKIFRGLPNDQVGKYWDRFAILNLKNVDLSFGSSIAPGRTMNFLIKFNQEIKSNPLPASTTITGYEIGENNDEIVMFTKEGWRVLFDINNGIKPPLQNLATLLQQKLKDRKGLQYIDLRFGSKIYYQ